MNNGFDIAHTNGTMEEKVIVKTEKRLSNMTLFWVSVLLTLGVGLTIAYCSGIINGVDHIEIAPFTVPNWLVIALPPVLFLHMGVALYFAIRENIYTEQGRAVRTWMWVFWLTLFAALAMLPYFVFNGMPIAAYIVASLAGGLALGSTILMYLHSVPAGITMTILLAVTSVIMIYLGYWAFA